MKRILIGLNITLSLIILTGCCSDIKEGFIDLSSQPVYKEWIGRKFKLTKEVLHVHNWQYNYEFLCEPGFGPERGDLPTIEDFKEKGITKYHITSYWKAVKIIPIGTIFEIEAIGQYSFNFMIGPRSLVFVRDKDNNVYVTEDLFDVGWIAPVKPHPDYITDLDGNYFPVKMNKSWEDFYYPVKIKTETYQEFYQRLTDKKELSFYPTSSRRIEIKFERIDKDNIDNISVYYECIHGGCEQELTAAKATVRDLGNGKAEILLLDAFNIERGEKGQISKKEARNISILYDYNGIVIQK